MLELCWVQTALFCFYLKKKKMYLTNPKLLPCWELAGVPYGLLCLYPLL